MWEGLSGRRRLLLKKKMIRSQTTTCYPNTWKKCIQIGFIMRVHHLCLCHLCHCHCLRTRAILQILLQPWLRKLLQRFTWLPHMKRENFQPWLDTFENQVQVPILVKAWTDVTGLQQIVVSFSPWTDAC